MVARLASIRTIFAFVGNFSGKFLVIRLIMRRVAAGPILDIFVSLDSHVRNSIAQVEIYLE